MDKPTLRAEQDEGLSVKFDDRIVTSGTGSISLASINLTPSLTLLGGKVTISHAGKVTFGEGYDPDEAARSFWQALGRRRQIDNASDDMLAALYRAENAMLSHNHTAFAHDNCIYDFGDKRLGGTLDVIRSAIDKATQSLNLSDGPSSQPSSPVGLSK